MKDSDDFSSESSPIILSLCLGIFRVWKRREMKQMEHSFDSGRWLSGLTASVGIIVREMHA